MENEKASAEKTSKQKVDLQSLPTRAYLDQTVVPILLQGLAVLAKERYHICLSFMISFLTTFTNFCLQSLYRPSSYKQQVNWEIYGWALQQWIGAQVNEFCMLNNHLRIKKCSILHH